MVRFYIVRHGQTLLNSLDRAQGWADSPLTEAGKQMVADIGQKLKGIDFDAVYTSDMLLPDAPCHTDGRTDFGSKRKERCANRKGRKASGMVPGGYGGGE